MEGCGDRLRLIGIALDELLEQAQLDGESDDLLLRAVVEVPLELPPLLVLRSHESLAGGAQLLDVVHQLLCQRDVSHHESRLRRKVAHEPLLSRSY